MSTLLPGARYWRWSVRLIGPRAPRAIRSDIPMARLVLRPRNWAPLPLRIGDPMFKDGHLDRLFLIRGDHIAEGLILGAADHLHTLRQFDVSTAPIIGRVNVAVSRCGHSNPPPQA